jgi:transposase
MSRKQLSTCNAPRIPAERQTEEQRAVVELMGRGCSVEETAKIVGVDRRVVYRWLRSGLMFETVERRYREFRRRTRWGN